MSGHEKPLASSPAQSPADGTFIEDPEMRRLFDYWRSRRAGRPLPAVGDIDPLDIAWALSRIYLVDYSPEEGFVYRLAGNDVAGVFGRANLKGLRPRDFLPPERAKPVEQRFRRVVDDRCLMWMKGMIYLRANRTPMGERLFLPLGDAAGATVVGVLGMTVIQSADAGNGADMDTASERFIPIDDLP